MERSSGLSNPSQQWHTRVPGNEHYHLFRNIVDVHQITRDWIRELNSHQSRHTYLLPRVQVTGVEENLWMLERLSDHFAASNLDELLDESLPGELLERLERTIWVVQSWTYREILQNTPASESSAMLNLLEQSSWKSGRAVAQARWSELPSLSRENLRDALAAITCAHIGGSSPRRDILVRRATPDLCEFEWLKCPHASPFAEVLIAADPLCQMHAQWVRGFVYELNTTIQASYIAGKSAGQTQAQPPTRCLHRWSLR